MEYKPVLKLERHLGKWSVCGKGIVVASYLNRVINSYDFGSWVDIKQVAITEYKCECKKHDYVSIDLDVLFKGKGNIDCAVYIARQMQSEPLKELKHIWK